MSSELQDQNQEQPLHPKGIREHTDGREFKPFVLLGVVLGFTTLLALLCYAIQIYFIGPL